MLPERETYEVEIEGVVRELPLFEVAPGLKIAERRCLKPV